MAKSVYNALEIYTKCLKERDLLKIFANHRDQNRCYSPSFHPFVAGMWLGLGFPMEGGPRMTSVTGVRKAALYQLVQKHFHNYFQIIKYFHN